MATIKSTDETFDSLVKNNKILVQDFWASWCGPCLQISPKLEQQQSQILFLGLKKIFNSN